MADHVAKVSVDIDAPAGPVWDALVDPEAIQVYMFGARVESTWEPGGAITWRGEFEGKPYEDRGTLLEVDPPRAMSYDHYSPSAGPDVAENHHTVTIALAEKAGRTTVTLSQDHNPTAEARAHSEKNWTAMLDGLRKYVEERIGAASAK
jgi:uncharacterized protein YndB with AHSA1/START domain